MTQNNNPFTVHAIIGLPGSGKTTFVENLGKVHFIDDWGDWKKEAQWNALRSIKEVSDLVYIASLDFCIKEQLEVFQNQILQEFTNVNFEYTYFENSPHKCARNIISRSESNGDVYYTKNGYTFMHGELIDNSPFWESVINQLFDRYPKYYIPESITPIQIKCK